MRKRGLDSHSLCTPCTAGQDTLRVWVVCIFAYGLASGRAACAARALQKEHARRCCQQSFLGAKLLGPTARALRLSSSALLQPG